MSRRELYRAVAQCTGDSISTVKRIGFILADPLSHISDPEDDCLGPHVIDWDEYQADPLFREGRLA